MGTPLSAPRVGWQARSESSAHAGTFMTVSSVPLETITPWCTANHWPVTAISKCRIRPLNKVNVAW